MADTITVTASYTTSGGTTARLDELMPWHWARPTAA
jgi:hypothetical protein